MFFDYNSLKILERQTHSSLKKKLKNENRFSNEKNASEDAA